MHCPVCGESLASVTARDVTVDVCRNGCGGVWFDNFELKRFQTSPAAGSWDEKILLGLPDRPRSTDGLRRYCPRCQEQKMQRHFYQSSHKVEIDSCPECGGCWLDAGELALVRSALAQNPLPQRAKAFSPQWDLRPSSQPCTMVEAVLILTDVL